MGSRTGGYSTAAGIEGHARRRRRFEPDLTEKSLLVNGRLVVLWRSCGNDLREHGRREMLEQQ